MLNVGLRSNVRYSILCFLCMYLLQIVIELLPPFPVFSWFTTAPFRSLLRSFAACLRTGRSRGLSRHCRSSTLWAERWCRPSTPTTTRPPACRSCRRRRESGSFALILGESKAQFLFGNGRSGLRRVEKVGCCNPMFISLKTSLNHSVPWY